MHHFLWATDFLWSVWFSLAFSLFFSVCVCVRMHAYAFSTVDECIQFSWATDLLWCAWFSLAFSLFFSVCVRMHAYVLFPLWMNASSFLRLLTFYGLLGFHLSLSLFSMCACACAHACVCAFSTDECIHFPWAIDFLWRAWFSLALSLFSVCAKCISCPADTS